MNELNIRMEREEKRIIKLEERTIEITQSEQQRADWGEKRGLVFCETKLNIQNTGHWSLRKREGKGWGSRET